MRFFRLAVACVIALGLGCQDRMADGGTETTNGTVVGMALYPDGKAAAGARIRLRPSDYLPGNNLRPGDSVFLRWESQCDAQGRFSLAGLDNGAYALEINDGKSYAACVRFDLATGLEKVSLPNSTLLRTSSLSGSVISQGNLGEFVSYVRVFGLERKSFVDRQGNFVLQDMPAGSFSLRINVAAPYFDSVTLAENHVSSDSDTKVGDVRIPLQGCTNYSCDSLAVRAILDANGKQAITVASVTTKDISSGRITTLKLTRVGIKSLPEELGSLTALKILKGQGNKLDSLPGSIVNLPVVEELDVEDNLLRSIPSRLGEMTSLIRLKLNTNNLTALPSGLGRLKNLNMLTVARTNLRVVPDDITNCKALNFLDLTSDSLTALPQKMGDLVSLKTILLDSNQLSNLPESMINLTQVTTLFLDGNSICAPLSPALESWVRLYSSHGVDWNKFQVCP